MPLYVITHKLPLTEPQRTSLAQQITAIHSTLFTTPELFVNVHFRPAPADGTSYIGGKPRVINSIDGFVRHNNTRTQAQYTELCNRMGAAWKTTFGDAVDKDEERKLSAIFIQGTILAAWEQGVMIPEAGNDEAWLKENWGRFKERADAGDEEMIDLVRDVERRKLIAV